jgi:hypothetical protein
MSNIVLFPPQKPPFLEISAEQCGGYAFAIRYRDERYRQMVIWRGYSHAETTKRAADYEPSFQLPVVDLSARSRG